MKEIEIKLTREQCIKAKDFIPPIEPGDKVTIVIVEKKRFLFSQ
jgi:hypothetical protein